MHLREAIRHLLRWGVTQAAGVQAVPTWEDILAAVAVPAGFRVAVAVGAVDVAAAAVGVAVADADNARISSPHVTYSARSIQNRFAGLMRASVGARRKEDNSDK